MKNQPSASFSQWIKRPETIIGLSALLLSLCGLAISFYQASLTRQAQRAATWPYVEIGASLRPNSIHLWVQNTGVGPARIRAGAVTFKGKLQANWPELLRNVAGEHARHINIYQSFINGRVLPANSARETIFSITSETQPQQQQMIEQLEQALLDGSVEVSLCYASVYHECWQTNLQDVLNPLPENRTPERLSVVENCESAPRSGI